MTWSEPNRKAPLNSWGVEMEILFLSSLSKLHIFMQLLSPLFCWLKVKVNRWHQSWIPKKKNGNLIFQEVEFLVAIEVDADKPSGISDTEHGELDLTNDSARNKLFRPLFPPWHEMRAKIDWRVGVMIAPHFASSRFRKQILINLVFVCFRCSRFK